MNRWTNRRTDEGEKIEMYSTHNEGKSVIPESFIRTLKNKFYKYKNLTLKNVYIDKLDDTVNEYKIHSIA